MDATARPAAGAVPMVDRVCRWLAVLGGVVMFALAVLTVVSVLGRYLFGQPIHGDFELVEMGGAIAISLFLPYCQLRNGNVIVDFVTMKAPLSLKRILDAAGCLLVSLGGAVLAWRLTLGGIDLHHYNDQTMVLQINTWIAYAVLVPCFALLAIVGVLTARRALAGELAPGEAH